MSIRPVAGRHYIRDAGAVANSNCTGSITLESPNSFHLNATNTIWANCCPSTSGDTKPPDCRPIEHHSSSCPAGYFSCADTRHHEEMCSIRYVHSQDGSGVFGYGEMSRTLQQKCCPDGYSCGGSFDAPCIYIKEKPPQNTVILTNPMYVKKIGVFPGCDEGRISPAAVGGIVAVAIIGMCAIGGFFLWLLRKRLFRSPARQRKSYAGRRPNAKSGEVEDYDGTASTVDSNSIKSPKIGVKPQSAQNLQPKKQNGASVEQQSEHRSTLFPSRARLTENGNGSFTGVHLDPQLASRVLDLAGITVTREVQVHVAHNTQKEDISSQETSTRSQNSSAEYLDDASCHEEPVTAIPMSRVIPSTREPIRMPSVQDFTTSIAPPPIPEKDYPPHTSHPPDY